MKVIFEINFSTF